MAAGDQGPGVKDPRTQAIIDAIADALDGAADETREYRPVTDAVLDGTEDETKAYRPAGVAADPQRLALKQQLRDVARLADFVPMRPPAAGTPARVTVPPPIASAPLPAAPRLRASRVSPVSPDQTIQLAPIAPAFAEAIAAPAGRPAARVRWALVLAMLTVALPAGLLLLPAPPAKPAAVHPTEPSNQIPAPGPEATPLVSTDLVAPQVSASAPRPARHARGGSTPKPAAASDPSAPHPTQTLER
jgi:hypothetical protein